MAHARELRRQQAAGRRSLLLLGRHGPRRRWSRSSRLRAGAEGRPVQAQQRPTALSYNETDRRLDLTPLSDYLVQRGAGPLNPCRAGRGLHDEFGREINRQSALALLFFIATNKRQPSRPSASSATSGSTSSRQRRRGAGQAGGCRSRSGWAIACFACAASRRPRAPELRHRGWHGRTVHDAVVLRCPHR